MSLLGNVTNGSTGVVPPPVNTLIYSNATPGPWSFTITFNGFVEVEGWGGGGPGSLRSGGGDGFKVGFGGGGGGYFKKHLAVTIGQVLSGVVGLPGFGIGPGVGGPTTLVSPGCTANGGGYALGAASEGLGGTATGGDTNTTGNAGGLTHTWDGGSGANGGGDQIVQDGAGTQPGGGSAGAEGTVNVPGAGQINITSVTS